MSCKIFLYGAGGHYTPGSEVKGTVECNFTESSTLVRGVKIRLKCKEHIGWKVGKSHFRKDNVVLWQGQQLLVSDPPVEHTGEQVFPFSFILPFQLPSSFRSVLGFVEYNLKATIDVPHWVDPTDTVTLLIHTPIRFNTSASDYPQLTVGCMEKPSGFCCSSGNLSMDVELLTTAFVLGETVNFRVYVQNLSSSNIDYLKTALVQKITYGPPLVSNHTRTVKTVLLAFTNSGVGAHGERSYNLSFTIPGVNPILNFNGSKLIEIEYYLENSLSVPFTCSSFEVRIPLRLGYSKCDVRSLENLGRIVHSASPFNYVLLFAPTL